MADCSEIRTEAGLGVKVLCQEKISYIMQQIQDYISNTH